MNIQDYIKNKDEHGAFNELRQLDYEQEQTLEVVAIQLQQEPNKGVIQGAVDEFIRRAKVMIDGMHGFKKLFILLLALGLVNILPAQTHIVPDGRGGYYIYEPGDPVYGGGIYW